MLKKVTLGAGVVLLGVGGFWGLQTLAPFDGTSGNPSAQREALRTEPNQGSFSETEPVFEEPTQTVPIGFAEKYTVEELNDWQRPAGPLRVGLQVGHLRNDEVPEELSGLTKNGAGATWGNVTERDTMEVIAELAAEELRAEGIEVDVLPTTVPPGYVADAFISLHADGNRNEGVRGYKTAHFTHDYSGRSPLLEEFVNGAYGAATQLPEDPSVTYYMTGYYAFNWWRYEHALHPMTPAVILETGFITNATDRRFLTEEPEVAAAGIARGVLDYLNSSAPEMTQDRRVDLPRFPVEGVYTCLAGRWDANDPPEERNAPCRPGLIREPNRRYGLLFPDGEREALLSDVASGTPIRIEGTFTPMVGVPDLTWYDYRVRGTIDVKAITPVP